MASTTKASATKKATAAKKAAIAKKAAPAKKVAPEKKPAAAPSGKGAAAAIASYLATLPEERKKALQAVRKIVLANLPKGIEESFEWGMIAYVVPLRDFPDTYNGKALTYAALASQKNYMAVYLWLPEGSPALKAFRARFAAAGKKLDMGKACVRFKTLEQLDLGAIGEAVASLTRAEFIATHAKVRAMR